MQKKDFIVLCFLILIFLLIRSLILSSNINFVYSLNGAQRAKLATDILILKKGGHIFDDIFDYPFSHYRGGSLVVSILYIPFAYLFGINTFSLKLVALSFSLGTFVVWYLFLYKYFNKKVAIFFGILFVINSPIFNTWSLITAGTYTEATFLVILGLFLICSLLNIKDKDIKPSKLCLYFLILGLLCGFSLYFDYSYLIAILGFFILWLIKDNKLYKKRYFFIFIGSFFIGFLPWFLARIVGDLRPNIILHGYSLNQIFLHKNISNIIMDIKHAILNIPNLSPSYKNDYIFVGFPVWIKEFAGYFYRGVFLFAFVYLILYQIKNKKINFPLLGIQIYVIIYILIYAMAIPELQYPRHSIPLYPFVFAIITIFLNLNLERKLNKLMNILRVSIFIILINISLLDNLNIISFKKISNPLRFKGYEYAYLLRCPFISESYINDLDKYISFKKTTNQLVRPLMEGFLPNKYVLEYRIEQSDLHWARKAEFIVRNNLVSTLNEQLRKGYPDIDNWGWAIGIIYRWDIEKCVNVIKKLRFTLTDDVQIVYYSLGLGIGRLDREKKNECIKELSKLDKDIQESVLKGVNDFIREDVL